MAAGELIFDDVDNGKWQNQLLPGVWASIVALFHSCSIIPSLHCSLLASGWSTLQAYIMERSVNVLICFVSKATLRGHLPPHGRKTAFPLEGDLFLPNSKNQLGIGLDSFQAIEITYLSGQQWKGFL